MNFDQDNNAVIEPSLATDEEILAAENEIDSPNIDSSNKEQV